MQFITLYFFDKNCAVSHIHECGYAYHYLQFNLFYNKVLLWLVILISAGT